jgi:hypothetical protein
VRNGRAEDESRQDDCQSIAIAFHAVSWLSRAAKPQFHGLGTLFPTRPLERGVSRQGLGMTDVVVYAEVNLLAINCCHLINDSVDDIYVYLKASIWQPGCRSSRSRRDTNAVRRTQYAAVRYVPHKNRAIAIWAFQNH